MDILYATLRRKLTSFLILYYSHHFKFVTTEYWHTDHKLNNKAEHNYYNMKAEDPMVMKT